MVVFVSAHIGTSPLASAESICGRPVYSPTTSRMEQAGTTTHRRAMFRASSTDWHRFLGFSSPERPAPSPWEDHAAQARLIRHAQLQQGQADMEGSMQRMMKSGPPAQFRGVQAPVMQAIQRGASPIVAVMPTGGGKSMLFMLPAWVPPGGTTVVVVPLIALRGDMKRRCDDLGIDCGEWSSRQPHQEAAIVLVTPESAMEARFQTFLNEMRLMRRLDRIVIDECHIMVSQEAEFRPVMQELGRLQRHQVPMMMLTATLPPTEEGQLWQQLDCTRAEVTMFRAPTTRRNVQYRVWRPVMPGRPYPRAWVEDEQVVRFIRERIQQADGGRVIIYAPWTTQVTAMAGILAGFVRSQQSVMVATSALGMGLDIPNIRSIIHIGTPRTMLDYAQESGRAGRDGQTSEAIIIQPVGWDEPPPWVDKGMIARRQYQAVQEYIGARCRRVVLDHFTDGHGRQDCEEDQSMACDGCQPDWEAYEVGGEPMEMDIDTDWVGSSQHASNPHDSNDLVPSSRSQHAGPSIHAGQSPRARSGSSESIQTQVTYEASATPAQPPAQPMRPATPASPRLDAAAVMEAQDREYARFYQVSQRQDKERARQDMDMMDEVVRWRNRCRVCYEHGWNDRHELFHCREPSSQAAQAWMKQVRSQIAYPRNKFVSCFTCHLPQWICQGAVQGTRCRNAGVLIPLVAGMLKGRHQQAIQAMWQQWLAERGVEMNDDRQVIWLLGQPVGSTMRQSQFVEMYHWLCGVIEANGRKW